MLPMALLMVVMGASPALASWGVTDLCVSQGGQTVYDTGASLCSSDATSQAVAINRSFAGALNHSQAVSINHAFAFAFDACSVVALDGEEVSC